MGVTTIGAYLYGDWRAGAYGANKRAHLFTFDGGHRKRPVCGARVDVSKTGSARKRALKDLCYDCLAAGAAGRV